MGILGNLFGSNKECEAILSKGGVVVDVRSPQEFASGHVPGSRNIPLGQLNQRIGELKKLKKPVVLCCASGMRSGAATGTLKKHGFECCNGGSWGKVARVQEKVGQ